MKAEALPYTASVPRKHDCFLSPGAEDDCGERLKYECSEKEKQLFFKSRCRRRLRGIFTITYHGRITDDYVSAASLYQKYQGTYKSPEDAAANVSGALLLYRSFPANIIILQARMRETTAGKG